MSNSFTFSPITPFPSPADEFPTGVQFKVDGDNLGSPNPTNVNFSGLSITGTYDETTDTVNFEVSAGGSGGGGGTPGGLTTEVQYNDSGTFGADRNFTWNKTSRLITLGSAADGDAAIRGFDSAAVDGSAGVLTISGGDASNDGGTGGDVIVKGGDQTFVGSTVDSTLAGNVVIRGGANATNTAGSVSVIGGEGQGGFAGGNVVINGGFGDSGSGGSIAIVAGEGAGGNGGSLTLQGGSSETAVGGDVSIGGADGFAQGGTVTITGGNAGGGLEVQGLGGSNAGNVRLFGFSAAPDSGTNGGDVLLKGGTGDPSDVTKSSGYVNIQLLSSVPSLAPNDWSSSGYAPLTLYRSGTTYRLYAYLGGGWRHVDLS